jgi:prephenate dehydrogenase
MTLNITIIGLGQIGTSIGLALAEKKADARRIGHDKNPETAKEAQRLGAIDDVKFNLPASVKDAGLVLLCLPLDQLRPTLEIIAPDLREDAVVIDFSPSKVAIAAWVKEILPQHCHYVGLTPALNASYLHDIDFGLSAARPDLFNGAAMLLDMPRNTPEQAMQLASNLTLALGAHPIFADSAEADGMMASVHLLPQLAAAALLNSTLEQAGWHEARQLASKPYALVTSAIAETDSLREAALSNKENTLRVLDSLIASLNNLRAAISAGDADWLDQRLQSAREGRLRWWQGRARGQWQDAAPQTADSPAFLANLKQALWGERRKPSK